MDEILIGIAMHDRQAVRHGMSDLAHIDLDPARIALPGAEEMPDKRPVTAPDIENAGARGDHLGDQSLIKAHGTIRV
ncbi:hypothetical protein AA21291_2061 [Swaminathania salitolerans LMG 21291]|uniref:Uncharacterized protein n=1 Tax=Swaminathania salitolerans TaxID=182838 RepID=A0A511BQ74_9PROT|nr:hypothetical protein AA21291_2061 [Swaminathania salitolerans LMG 21291]GEL01993.1 hypothetical protein SSA02_11560 [Swaminathania salitolerans]